MSCSACPRWGPDCRGCPVYEGLNALEEVHETDVRWSGKTELQLEGAACYVCGAALQQWGWVMGGGVTVRQDGMIGGHFVPRCLDGCVERPSGSAG